MDIGVSMKSIQSKFLTIIISGILILAVAIAAISFVSMSRILEKDSDMITDSVANTEALKINTLMRDVEYVVKSMKNHVLSTVTSTDFLADAAQCNEYTAKAKETFNAIVGNFQQIAGFYLRFSPELAHSDAGFLISKTKSSVAYFTEHPTTDLSDWQNAPENEVCWFTVPMQQQDAVWLPPRVAAVSQLEVLSYVIPIYVGNTFVGVVGVDLMYSAVTDMVSGITVYDNGFAYLSDADKSEVYFSPVGDHKLEAAEEHHGFAEEYKTLTNGMTLVIHADYSDIQRDGYIMIVIIVITAFGFLLFFAIITIFLTNKKIVKPLKNLTKAAEQLAEGGSDFNFEKYDIQDEVGILTAAFEKMAKKQQEYMGYINALAYKDSLTGIKNRTAYNEAANELEVKIKVGNYEPFAILIADINRLKVANDKYGHEIGNKLIVRAAKIICDTFKHSPVYRIGGDEFLVLLTGEDLDAREALMEQMDEKCGQSFIEVDDDKIPVSIARAAEMFDPERDVSVDDVFKRADMKMYEHKEKNRRN